MPAVNLSDLLRTIARIHSEKPALIDQDRALTYGELDDLIDRTASHLLTLGVAPGDRVGLCLHDNADFLIAMFAVWRIDATAVAMDWRGKGAERAAFAARFDVSLVLEHRLAPDGSGYPASVVDGVWHESVARSAPLGPYQRTANRIAYFNMSSGTTGEPTAIPMTHSRLLARAVINYIEGNWGALSVYVSVLPFQFSVARSYCTNVLIAGGAVYVLGSMFNPQQFLEVAERYSANQFALVPPMVRNLIALPASDGLLLPNARSTICLGAVLHSEEKRQALAHISSAFCDLYGTSSGGLISVLPPDAIATHAETVGRPAAHVVVEIIDESDRPVATGETGSLRFLPSETIFLQDKTPDDALPPEMVRDGWHYSGDIARLDEDGFIHLLGRSSDIIIRGGANLYPGEIEAVLTAHPAVKDAAVVPWPSRLLGEEIAAFVVLSADVSKQDLMLLCRTKLSAAKLPRDIFLVDDLPRNTNGKVLKRELSARLTMIDDG
ncbi:MAG: acyl--CoA ligase [Alphaproteobacteria bacterium]|nr:acyl--CoA ligase [Alphaproteobacteria bacterium]